MITIVCPVLNEEKFVRQIISFFMNANPSEKEIIFIDGGSCDHTIDLISDAVSKNPRIRLLINEKKYVSFALNKAIQNSTGDPIIRLDAHTKYSDDYLEKIISTFEQTGADIVGGPMTAFGETRLQKAIAVATSSRFGIGNSRIHQNSYSGESDHVYLGAWKREIFDVVGFFDEKLVRNQDDEFHYRAKSLGKRIYLCPEIKSFYYPRNSLFKLFKQYFEYGLFKPYVLWKIKSAIKIRHLMPTLFFLYLVLILLLNSGILTLMPLLLYFFFTSFQCLIAKEDYSTRLFLFFVFPVIHIAYGLGFFVGIPYIVFLIRKPLNN